MAVTVPARIASTSILNSLIVVSSPPIGSVESLRRTTESLQERREPMEDY